MDKIFDICIIGTGPAGAFATKDLANHGKDVVVIEAGGKDVDSEVDNIIDVENSNIPGTPDFGFSQQIGGASNLWGGSFVELDEVDFIKREEFGFNGWLFKKDELVKYYKKVDKYIGIELYKNLSNDNKKFIGKKNIDMRYIITMDKPFNTKVLLENNLNNITLLDNSVAIQLILSSSKQNIKAVEIYDKRTKCTKKIYAKQYILASGTLTNIRLLLHSLKNIRSNIPKLYNNIGRYFSTHPKGDIGTLKLYNPINYDNSLVSFIKQDKFIYWHQFGLNKDFLLEHTLLNHCLRFSSPFHQRISRIFDMIKKIIGAIPIFRNGKLANILVKLGVHIFKFIDHARFFSFNNKKLVIRAFFDQKSSSINRVTISDKTSKEGLPLAKIDYMFDETDWEEVEKFINIFSQELERLDIGKLEYKRPTKDKFTGMHSHFIGGTRMGESSDNSVVDKNLKVHGFHNLYLSGPSTFPSFGYANPFYSIAALSLRLADYLKGKDD
jgi:hypothetical protein